ncbi:MAG: hypothetical protein WCB58_18045 [Acidobacteriaceae bacterium]
MTALIWTANLLGWPVLHLSVAYSTLRLPSGLFARDTWLTAPRAWERDGKLYRKWFSIRKWKRLLPDGAPWLGGFPKRKLRARDPVYLSQFLLETRRAQVAHWCMLGGLPVFFFWNPTWARLVMIAYAVASNLPCIIVQRYNRLALERAVRTRGRAQVRP